MMTASYSNLSGLLWANNISHLGSSPVLSLRSLHITIMSTITVCTVLLGVLFNLILIITIGCSRQLRVHAAKWVLCNMAVSLIAEAVVSLPNVQFVQESLPFWLRQPEVCKVMAVLQLGTITAGPVSIILVVTERLTLLSKSNRKLSGWSRNITLLIISLSWMSSIILACMFAFVFGNIVGIGIPTKGYKCLIINYASGVYITGILKLGLTLVFVIITIIIPIVYHNRPGTYTNMQTAVLPSMLTIGLFLLLWLPLILFNMATSINHTLKQNNTSGSDVWLFQLSTWYWFLMPVCWLFGAKDIRTVFRSICCSKCFHYKDTQDEEIPLQEE